MAGGFAVTQFLPYMRQRAESLVGVGGRDGDGRGIAQREEAADDRPALPKGVLVGQDEDLIVFTLGYREGNILFQIS